MATLRKRSQCLSSANRRGRFNETSKCPRRSKRSSRRSVTPMTTRSLHAEQAPFSHDGYLVTLRYDAAVRRPCRPGSTRTVDTGYRDPRLTARSILRPRQTIRTERLVAGGAFLRLNTTPISFPLRRDGEPSRNAYGLFRPTTQQAESLCRERSAPVQPLVRVEPIALLIMADRPPAVQGDLHVAGARVW